jgi:hypothetical protein
MAAPKHPAVVASTASLRVEPTGPASRNPRDYLVTLELRPSVPTAESVASAQALAAGVLSGLSSDAAATAQPTVHELRGRPARDPAAPTQVSGAEGAVVCADWPARAMTTRIVLQLIENGYVVSSAARRACAEPGCTAEVALPWSHRDERPRDWYTERICGRHNYRACVGCGSVFRLVSSNATGPAPSVPCPICQVLLVEWGGTKHWEAELVSRGR